jgi:hypothetical protein
MAILSSRYTAAREEAQAYVASLLGLQLRRIRAAVGA